MQFIEDYASDLLFGDYDHGVVFGSEWKKRQVLAIMNPMLLRDVTLLMLGAVYERYINDNIPGSKFLDHLLSGSVNTSLRSTSMRRRSS